MDGLRAWLRLARTPGFHAGTLAPLLSRFGNVAALLAVGRTGLAEAGLPSAAIEALIAPDERLLDADERWLQGPGHSFIPWGDEQYPPLLAAISDPPVGLFVAGSIEALSTPQLAMVGSRDPTQQGRETAQVFASHLVGAGLTVTSGLAVGIDAASHRGALAAGGRTLAVCGTSLDTTYPGYHRQLAEQIAANGALVSEFPAGTPPMKQNFPRRNRLISGLSCGTLVVEAALRSGSLITARLAADQGREVFAIPGSIHNPLARGCHQLIRDGATLVETADDILSGLGTQSAAGVAPRPFTGGRESADSARVSAGALDKDRKILLDALGFDPAGVDQLVQRTGLKVGEVASMLLILELEGHIESFPGGRYVRAHPSGHTLKATK